MNALSLFFKRRNFVVRPDLQYRLMFSAVGHGIFCMLAVAVCLLYPLVAELQQVDGNPEEALAAAEQLLYIVDSAWIVLPLCVVAIALASLRLSHRIAGPLNRFHAAFEAVKNGHVCDPVQLRENDLLRRDMDLINEMLDSLRERADEQGRLVAATDAAAEPSANEARTAGATPTGASERGFSLTEVMIAVAVLAILSMIAIPKFISAMHNARVVKATVALKALSRAVIKYRTENEMEFPPSLESLNTRMLFDPWNNPYEYVVLEKTLSGKEVGKPRVDDQDRPLNTDFDLFSRGVNGLSSEKVSEPHGLDDIVRGRNGGFFGVAKSYSKKF